MVDGGQSSRRSTTFQAGGENFQVFKSCLKEWLSLDEIQEQISKNPSAKGIYDYLSKATGKGIDFWEKLSWYETVQAYSDISLLNKIDISLPMLEVREVAPVKEIPWDYPGRSWYIWLHLFAKIYGWSAEYIAMLEIEDALALFQENETDRQLDREWQWQLTELAYPMNMTTKKSEFHPLPRPAWMKVKVGPPKPVKISTRFMPVGNVVDLMHYAEPDQSV